MNALQFTHWLEDEEDCHEWFRWFTERGVPVAIVSNGGNEKYGKDRYCVMRQGDVYKYSEKGRRAMPAVLQKMPSNYKVLHDRNGFVK